MSGLGVLLFLLLSNPFVDAHIINRDTTAPRVSSRHGSNTVVGTTATTSDPIATILWTDTAAPSSAAAYIETASQTVLAKATSSGSADRLVNDINLLDHSIKNLPADALKFLSEIGNRISEWENLLLNYFTTASTTTTALSIPKAPVPTSLTQPNVSIPLPSTIRGSVFATPPTPALPFLTELPNLFSLIPPVPTLFPKASSTSSPVSPTTRSSTSHSPYLATTTVTILVTHTPAFRPGQPPTDFWNISAPIPLPTIEPLPIPIPIGSVRFNYSSTAGISSALLSPPAGPLHPIGNSTISISLPTHLPIPVPALSSYRLKTTSLSFSTSTRTTTSASNGTLVTLTSTEVLTSTISITPVSILSNFTSTYTPLYLMRPASVSSSNGAIVTPSSDVSDMLPPVMQTPVPETSFSSNARNNIAAYYHPSSSSAPADLSDLCQDSSVNIINIPLVTKFHGPQAYPMIAHFPGCGTANDDQILMAPGLRNCSSLADSVRMCQALGKKIIISVSNGTTTLSGDTSAPNNTFTTRDQARQLAATLWNLFGGGTVEPSTLRPFGPEADITVDGFGIEDPLDNAFYDVLASTLREYYAQDTNKTYYVTTSQSCTIPSTNASTALRGVDFVYIRTQDGTAATQCPNNLTDLVGRWNAALSPVPPSIRSWSRIYRRVAGLQQHQQDLPRLYIGATAWPSSDSDLSSDSAYDVVARDEYSNPALVKSLSELYAGGQGAGAKNLGGVAFWPGEDGEAGWAGVGTLMREVKVLMG